MIQEVENEVIHCYNRHTGESEGKCTMSHALKMIGRFMGMYAGSATRQLLEDGNTFCCGPFLFVHEKGHDKAMQKGFPR